MADLDKLAMHQGTTPFWTMEQAVEAYARHGFRAMTARREKFAEMGGAAAAKLICDAGMEVIGLSGIAPMTASDPGEQQAQRDELTAMIDDAAALGAGFIVIVGGPMSPGTKSLEESRQRMSDMMASVLPHARDCGVKLGLEPLSPMIAGENSCVNLMETANDMCEALGEGVGLVVDVWHVWWDPNLRAELERAGGENLLGLHICDWRAPLKDRFQDRAMMGDGFIEIPKIEGWMREAGFTGWNEIEIFSAEDWWKRDPEEFLATCVERYKTHV